LWESLAIVFAFTLVVFWYSQRKFQNKLYCTFHGADKVIVHAFVPKDARNVKFSWKKGENGLYAIIPSCIEHLKYTGGVNKLFPAIIPHLEFYWYCPYPVDPNTGQPSWLTPEARSAAWDEHQHIAYARASVAMSGTKKKLLDVLIPLITVGLIVIVGYLVYQNSQAIQHLEQSILALMQQNGIGIPKTK
jgi:hypothetical protein